MTQRRAELSTLEAIRAEFSTRFEAASIGYHALGEKVAADHAQAGAERVKPASAMTFRNFLQDKTQLRDPRGLELYFVALGASDEEMRQIRITLQQELDRRVIAPAQQQALRAFDENGLASMPYAQALLECEALMRFEQSTVSPVQHATPLHYLLGPDATQAAPSDPRRWGLVHHLHSLTQFLSDVDLVNQNELAAIPRAATAQRQLAAAADLRELLTACAHYLLYRPKFAEFLFSRRRYILQGHVPEEDRQLAINLSRRLGKIVFAPVERFAHEVVLGGDDPRGRGQSHEAKIALEIQTERALSVPNIFYVTVVQGSQGTGGVFRSAYQYRRPRWHTELAGPAPWSEHHEAIVASYDDAVAAANRMIEDDNQVKYGDIKEEYRAQFRAARPHMAAVWESDYAGRIVLETALGIATGFHAAKLLSDAELSDFMKLLLTSARGKSLQQARHAQRRFAPLTALLPSEAAGVVR